MSPLRARVVYPGQGEQQQIRKRAHSGARSVRSRSLLRSVVGTPDERRRAAAVVAAPEDAERIDRGHDPVGVAGGGTGRQRMRVTALRPAAVVVSPDTIAGALFQDV